MSVPMKLFPLPKSEQVYTTLDANIMYEKDYEQSMQEIYSNAKKYFRTNTVYICCIANEQPVCIPIFQQSDNKGREQTITGIYILVMAQDPVQVDFIGGNSTDQGLQTAKKQFEESVCKLKFSGSFGVIPVSLKQLKTMLHRSSSQDTASDSKENTQLTEDSREKDHFSASSLLLGSLPSPSSLRSLKIEDRFSVPNEFLLALNEEQSGFDNSSKVDLLPPENGDNKAFVGLERIFADLQVKFKTHLSPDDSRLELANPSGAGMGPPLLKRGASSAAPVDPEGKSHRNKENKDSGLKPVNQ